MAEAKYQALRNQMVACARVCRYAHETYPDLQMGMMLRGEYPGSMLRHFEDNGIVPKGTVTFVTNKG